MPGEYNKMVCEVNQQGDIMKEQDYLKDYLDEMLKMVKEQSEIIRLEDLWVDFKSADGCQIFAISNIGKPIKFIHEDR